MNVGYENHSVTLQVTCRPTFAHAFRLQVYANLPQEDQELSAAGGLLEDAKQEVRVGVWLAHSIWSYPCNA